MPGVSEQGSAHQVLGNSCWDSASSTKNYVSGVLILTGKTRHSWNHQSEFTISDHDDQVKLISAFSKENLRFFTRILRLDYIQPSFFF